VTGSATAAAVLAHVEAQPALLGGTRLVCIDGPAGSGKTTLAGQVAELGAGFVVHLDDLYPGWTGLPELDPLVLRLLTPLAHGMTGYYRRWDWDDSEYRETHHVDPTALLVLEGVGSGNRAWRRLVSTLVWVEAPPDVRLSRGLERDGVDVREKWLQWMADEAELFEEEATRAAADLVVDTS
jgi:uridine kinase